MNTLRATLEILFSEMRIEPLLKSDAGHPDFDKELFKRLYQRKNPACSMDQCDIMARMASSCFLYPRKDCNDLLFCPKESVFNALLHFSSDALRRDSPNLVCYFENVLRWDSLGSMIGEDLLVVSFLASKDAWSNSDRDVFSWGEVGQDNPALNEVFSREMADVHMHLDGSSNNFELNWLSLVNYPMKRGKSFQEFGPYMCPQSIMGVLDEGQDPLCSLAIKACAIRFYLYVRYVKNIALPQSDYNLICGIVKEGCLDESMLDSLIQAERDLKRSSPDDPNNCDYAFETDVKGVKYNPNSVLSGERRILYYCFRACYSDELSETDSKWLYAYILIKNRIRRELIQLNGVVGFDNFNSYERRKSLFIKNYPLYERLVAPLAIGPYFNGQGPRLVEPRVSPKSTGNEIDEMIKKTDKSLSELTKAELDRVQYVLHFIKSADTPIGDQIVLNPRNDGLREKVKKQAYAIADFRRNSASFGRIVGIDAANSEILARPEVFAQAFRFLQNASVNRSDGERVANLGRTYHVGEDFLSPIDGLRAIDEVLRFMHFEHPDRLGHALVLGINASKYLEERHYTLLMPIQVALDDVAWALHEIPNNEDHGPIIYMLEKEFDTLFEEVYGVIADVRPSDYFDSWLLRGDNPDVYRKSLFRDDVQLTEWSKYNLSVGEDVAMARTNPLACELFARYHFDCDVRKAGEGIREFRLPHGFDHFIESLQRVLLERIKKRAIGIETNPTSNLKIGGFEFYRDLPILGCELFRSMASVNTDDRGIFSTCLEREYSLLACAYYKANRDDYGDVRMLMEEVRSLADAIRENGLNQAFINSVGLREPNKAN